MTRLRDGVTLALLLLPLLLPGKLHAWGDTGHEIVCEIAFQELNPKAKAEVRRLIRLDPDFSTFSASCTWPDHPRKRSQEHSVNLRRSASGIGNDPCPTANKCVVTAIAEDSAVLADANTSDSDKVEALKFLGHWVGDVHQPLHVSFRDDLGGNEIRESGSCSGSLHSVWDTCIILEKLGNNVRAIAAAVLEPVSLADKAEWISLGPKDWANESYEITLSESVEYCVKKQNECWYAADNRTYSDGEEKRVVRVDDGLHDRAPSSHQAATDSGRCAVGRDAE